jgi:hypothetical protein
MPRDAGGASAQVLGDKNPESYRIYCGIYRKVWATPLWKIIHLIDPSLFLSDQKFDSFPDPDPTN